VAVTHVLALRALGLGDALTAVPALRSVRDIWPGCHLTLAGPRRLGTWLAALGVVDGVVPVSDIRDRTTLGRVAGSPDVAVNLHGRGPQSHRLLQALRPRQLAAFRCDEAGHREGPRWTAGMHEVDRWLQLTASLGGSGSAEDLRLPAQGPRAEHVVIHPGAASTARRWPAERWATVAAALSREGHRVVVTGSALESALCADIARRGGAVSRAGREDLPALARTVGTAALLLSGDTGVAHLATALSTPSVTLFGPVSPELWGPRIDLDRHHVLWSGDPGVLLPGDPHGERLDPHLAAIDVDAVLAAARQVLGSALPARPGRPVADSAGRTPAAAR
jgi:ADP-heptose:LPS heptosyltransferase